MLLCGVSCQAPARVWYTAHAARIAGASGTVSLFDQPVYYVNCCEVCA
jgi:hypothetical protein